MRHLPMIGIVGLAFTLAACNQAEQQAGDTAAPPAATMPGMPMPAPEAAAAYSTTGEITAIDGSTVTINHQPVPALNWPSMTMNFMAPEASMTTGLEVGTQVEFSFRQEGNEHVLATIKPR